MKIEIRSMNWAPSGGFHRRSGIDSLVRLSCSGLSWTYGVVALQFICGVLIFIAIRPSSSAFCYSLNIQIPRGVKISVIPHGQISPDIPAGEKDHAAFYLPSQTYDAWLQRNYLYSMSLITESSK